MKEIPVGSIEIQEGLWAELRTFMIGGVSHSRYNVFSSEGYCFWEKSQPENYNENGELLPVAERFYSQFAITPFTTIEQINESFVSVPVEKDFVIS